MKIRKYRENDYREIAVLFHASVHAINNSAYTDDDLEAWAPSLIDYDHWKSRLALKKPYVAIQNNGIVGFIELESSGHIDCLYVHPDYQKQGIATKLLEYVVSEAKKKGLDKLFVEASDVAKLLFIANGFQVISENEVQLRGRILRNYKMDLYL